MLKYKCDKLSLLNKLSPRLRAHILLGSVELNDIYNYNKKYDGYK